MAVTATVTTTATVGVIMNKKQYCLPPALLRLQSWPSAAFATGSYSHSQSPEWAVETVESQPDLCNRNRQIVLTLSIEYERTCVQEEDR